MKNLLWRNDDSKSQLWHTFYWKAWNDLIYAEYITSDDIHGVKAPQNYHEVFTFDSETGEPYAHPVQPISLQKVVFIRKHNRMYMLPIKFEQDFPLKPIETFECLEKKSNKIVHHFVTKVKTITVPADNNGKTFRQRIDEFNPVQHTNPMHFTLMKLLAFASAYGGLGLGVCSNTNFGKGVNFNILKYSGQKISIVTSPSEALLYQIVSTSKIIVFDEITSVTKERVELIETAVIKLKDNTPELPKQALTKGYQKRSADITQMSVVFTFNRPQDLVRGKPFEQVWQNPAAVKSRFPLFLLEGEVSQMLDNPTPNEINHALASQDEFFKDEMKQTQYWVDNLHTSLKGWDRSVLSLKKRHYTNAKVWVDAIEAYCQTPEEFRTYLIELNKCRENYDRMVKGIELLGTTEETHKVTSYEFKDGKMQEVVKYV